MLAKVYSSALTSITYPARFILVTAMNPCPCGYFGDPRRECSCTPLEIQKHLMKKVFKEAKIPKVQSISKVLKIKKEEFFRLKIMIE